MKDSITADFGQGVLGTAAQSGSEAVKNNDVQIKVVSPLDQAFQRPG